MGKLQEEHWFPSSTKDLLWEEAKDGTEDSKDGDNLSKAGDRVHHLNKAGDKDHHNKVGASLHNKAGDKDHHLSKEVGDKDHHLSKVDGDKILNKVDGGRILIKETKEVGEATTTDGDIDLFCNILIYRQFHHLLSLKSNLRFLISNWRMNSNNLSLKLAIF